MNQQKIKGYHRQKDNNNNNTTTNLTGTSISGLLSLTCKFIKNLKRFIH